MAKVTYRAPEGDDVAVTMHGARLFDGVPIDVESPASVAAFKANRFFDVSDIEIEAIEMTEEPKRRGRPPKPVEILTEDKEGGE
jgi:hypothetical protein